MSVSPDPNRPGPGCGSFPSSPLNLGVVTQRWGNKCQLQKQQMPLAAEAREEGERSEQGPVRPPSDLPAREAGGGNVTAGQPPAAVSVGTGPARRTLLGPLEAGDGAWGKPWTRAQCRVSPSAPVRPGIPSPGRGFLSPEAQHCHLSAPTGLPHETKALHAHPCSLPFILHRHF